MEGVREEGFAAALSGRGTGKGGASAARGPMGKAAAGRSSSADAAIDLRPEQAMRRMKQLEAEMFKAARNLEFEEAARLRDEIERLKRAGLGLPSVKAS